MPSARATLTSLACAAALVGASAGPAAAADAPVARASADCSTSSSIVYAQGVSCAFARKSVAQLRRTGRAPKGWSCASGSRFKAGGHCTKGRKSFGFHPAD